MDKIIYERNGDIDWGVDVVEPKRISFDIESGISIYDFKIICKRLASAIGYTDKSIRDAFGDE